MVGSKIHFMNHRYTSTYYEWHNGQISAPDNPILPEVQYKEYFDLVNVSICPTHNSDTHNTHFICWTWKITSTPDED
jgi:hypothetical protein